MLIVTDRCAASGFYPSALDLACFDTVIRFSYLIVYLQPEKIRGAPSRNLVVGAS